jgi:hypothetical protein
VRQLKNELTSDSGVGYLIDDPREMAGQNPYTFFLPQPYLIDQLRVGDLVKNWERCIVDDAILDDSLRVERLERKAPKASDDDTVVDSGWHIWADTRGLTDEEIAMRPYSYVALGKVLNQDDSWIHLIDSPKQSSFTRNWQNGQFEEDANELDEEQ